MAEQPTIQEGPGKGRAFFERARTVTESQNYDFAIEMYLEGLNREPNNIPEHQALYDVSLRRKVKGGKPAGGLFGAKGPLKGKTPKDQMLNAEWLLAKDPGNISYMLTLVRQALAGNYPEVIMFFGPLLLLANRAKPKKDIFLELADTYEKIGEFDRASEALRAAIEMAPEDGALQARSMYMAAQQTIKKGQFDTEQDFKESLRSKEETKELSERDNLVKSVDYRLQAIEKAKMDYEANPREHQVISKYAKALWEMEDENYEHTAIEVLMRAYVETKTYRYKVYVGDIKIKQFKRHLRVLREALRSDPKDKVLHQQVQDLTRDQLAFELEEYKERVANYPTEMQYQYEYGMRLFQSKLYDDAIGALQVAQNNPKVRVFAQYYLGLCFNEKGLKHEAMETLRRCLEGYELADNGDQLSKEIHYWLARTLEDTGGNPEAIAIYSKITQWDYNFRDVRKRLEELRVKVS